MAIKSFQYTLAQNVRQVICPPSTQPQEVHVHNHEHGSNKMLFVGGSDVTAANGHHVFAESDIRVTLHPSQSLYGFTDESGGIDVTVLCVGK